MLSRLLLITYEGAPRSWHTTAGETRDEILKLAAEDADLVDVWAIYRDHRETSSSRPTVPRPAGAPLPPWSRPPPAARGVLMIKLGSVSLDVTAYASQGTGILGIRDSGKTYTATMLAEHLMDAGVPILASTRSASGDTCACPARAWDIR